MLKVLKRDMAFTPSLFGVYPKEITKAVSKDVEISKNINAAETGLAQW